MRLDTCSYRNPSNVDIPFSYIKGIFEHRLFLLIKSNLQGGFLNADNRFTIGFVRQDRTIEWIKYQDILY